MRKGFNGLYGLVRDRLECDPASGHVFLFTNARRNRLKLLVYDGSGLWVYTNRWRKISVGRRETAVKKIVLTHEELALLLGGIDLTQTQTQNGIARSGEEPTESLKTA